MSERLWNELSVKYNELYTQARLSRKDQPDNLLSVEGFFLFLSNYVPEPSPTDSDPLMFNCTLLKLTLDYLTNAPLNVSFHFFLWSFASDLYFAYPDKDDLLRETMSKIRMHKCEPHDFYTLVRLVVIEKKRNE